MTTVAATVHGKAGKGTTEGGARDPAAAQPAVGKRTLIEALPTPVLGSATVQHKGKAERPLEGSAAVQVARHGTEQLGKTTAEPTPEDIPAPTDFKTRAPHMTGKEASTDIPSWARNWPDARPGIHEDGKMFATRMMDRKYGKGGWQRTGQQGEEFSELRKFADRAFR